jgi:hypothetical protein
MFYNAVCGVSCIYSISIVNDITVSDKKMGNPFGTDAKSVFGKASHELAIVDRRVVCQFNPNLPSTCVTESEVLDMKLGGIHIQSRKSLTSVDDGRICILALESERFSEIDRFIVCPRVDVD